MRGLFSIITRLPHYLRLAWRLLWDPRIPGLPKLFVILAVIYGLSPIDLIPEALLPPLGFGEDLVLLFLSIRNLIVHSPPEIVQQHAKDIAQKKK